MAESVGGRLFFAGEATNHKYPATMHGAFDSGLCRAAQIVEELDCSPRGRPVHATAGELTGKAKQLHALFRTKSPDVEFGMFAAM